MKKQAIYMIIFCLLLIGSFLYLSYLTKPLICFVSGVPKWKMMLSYIREGALTNHIFLKSVISIIVSVFGTLIIKKLTQSFRNIFLV